VPSFSWIRLVIVLPLLVLFLLAQRYWFLTTWRWAGRIRRPAMRRAARVLCASGFSLVVVLLLINAFIPRRDLLWQFGGIVGAVGLWVTSAFWAYLAVQAVTLTGWVGRQAGRLWKPTRNSTATNELIAEQAEASITPAALSRRDFLHTTAAVAGAVPFALGGYGFLIGRRQYEVCEVSLPVSHWSAKLEGLRIVQLSDIHIGSYMSAAEVRRVVGMANELEADLAVVTGDFVTGAGDPLEECIRELSCLRAPLGIWGCNGNHEIYAGVEAETSRLFAQHGMSVLRQESVELVRHAESFNLIGVDYQRPPYDPSGQSAAMLSGINLLVRRDMPNILLSHNPNAFPRATELGIELTLAGHTHGGQVRFEFLDPGVSPARLLTPYVAGLFKRPLGASAALPDEPSWAQVAAASEPPASLLYVNSGLGTIFAPVRLGVPPEISLFTLRRA
jgi:predicted MPP superfamily phosphohydrolase